MIFVGILMVITAIIQLALMIVRYGMLVLLVGVLPLTAAATNTEMGMTWFKRAVAWLASVHHLQTGGGDDLCHRDQPDGGAAAKAHRRAANLNVIMGVTMMLVAVVALPAILRFVSPRTS